MRAAAGAGRRPRDAAHVRPRPAASQGARVPRCGGAPANRWRAPGVRAGSSSSSSGAATVLETQPLVKFQAHSASVTALEVLDDQPGVKRLITTGLDKTLCTWTLSEQQRPEDSLGEGEGDEDGEGEAAPALGLTCTRVEVAGGPVFSLQRGLKPKIAAPNTKPQSRPVFCGLAAKEIAAWQPDSLAFSDKVRMNGHTGWVRSLAASGKYLFSCGCNHLRQWDQAYAVPKEVSSTKLFTGDILAIAATDRAVYTAGADGSLRAWTIGKLGELVEGGVRDKAHDGRVTSLVAAGSLLFSGGYDGTIKAWDVSTLKLVMEVKAAHAGERVQALALGPGSKPGSGGASSSTGGLGTATAQVAAAAAVPAAASAGAAGVGCPAPGPPSSSPSAISVLFSGGDDCLVRCWDARLLVPIGEPLAVHGAAVKALAVGESELLVSGDASGEVALWSV